MANQQSHPPKGGKVTAGLALLAIGIILLAYVHSMRPPEGLGDAFRMLVDGNGSYFKEPYYSVFMAGSGIIALIGVILLVTCLVNNDKQ